MSRKKKHTLPTESKAQFHSLLQEFQDALRANPKLGHLVVKVPPFAASELPGHWREIVNGFLPRKHPLDTGRNAVTCSVWIKWPKNEGPSQIGYLYGPGSELKTFERLAATAWFALPETAANQPLELLGKDRGSWPKLYVDPPNKLAPPSAPSERWLWFVYWTLRRQPGNWLKVFSQKDGYEITQLSVDPFTASKITIDALLTHKLGAPKRNHARNAWIDRAALSDTGRSGQEGGAPLTETSIRREGDFWHLHYGGEFFDYGVRGNQSITWLAKLLGAPNRLLTVADLRGDPEGKLAADSLLGEEPETDRDGIIAIKNDLEEIEALAQEFGWNESLETRKEDALRRLKNPSKQLTSQLKKDHHNIATQIRAFLNEKLSKNMPMLAAHLKASLKLEFPNFGYFPPVGTPSWET